MLRRLRLQCSTSMVYNKIGDIETVHIRLRLVRTLTISCGALARSEKRNQCLGPDGLNHTYFLFLFEPPGSSTSIPSSSFRPALAAARLLAFCFSRTRSA